VLFQSPVALTLTNIMALVGNLKELPFTDLLQLCCAFRGTTHIKLDFGNNSGSVFLKNFEIIDAEIGDLKGEQAFHKILLQKDGKFLTETDPKFSPVRTINRSWADLLFDGRRLIGKTQAETSDTEPPKPTYLKDEILEVQEITVSDISDKLTLKDEISGADEIMISDTSDESIDSVKNLQSFDEIEDEEEMIVLNTSYRSANFVSILQPFDGIEDEDDVMVLNNSPKSTLEDDILDVEEIVSDTLDKSTDFDLSELTVDEINNQTNVHSSSEDNAQFELDVQNSSNEHDALLQNLLSSGVVKSGVVIDEDGSTICEISENDPNIKQLASLVKNIEDIVMSTFYLGDLNGAVLEIQQTSLLIKNFQNLSLVFSRPERVPIVRAFDGVQKAFEGALGLPK
jgi:Domain of unknown function (DUF4388)